MPQADDARHVAADVMGRGHDEPATTTKRAPVRPARSYGAVGVRERRHSAILDRTERLADHPRGQRQLFRSENELRSAEAGGATDHATNRSQNWYCLESIFERSANFEIACGVHNSSASADTQHDNALDKLECAQQQDISRACAKRRVAAGAGLPAEPAAARQLVGGKDENDFFGAQRLTNGRAPWYIPYRRGPKQKRRLVDEWGPNLGPQRTTRCEHPRFPAALHGETKQPGGGATETVHDYVRFCV